MRNYIAIGYLSTSTLIKALGGLAASKLIAISASVSDFGQISQFMAMVAFTGMLAAGGISPGVTRTLAERCDKNSKERWIAAIIHVYIVATALLAITLCLFSSKLSIAIFGNPSQAWAIAILGITQGIVGIGTLFQASAAAHGNYKEIFLSNAIGVSIGIIILALAVAHWNYEGALLGVAILAAGPGLYATFIISRNIRKLLKISHTPIEFKRVGHLLSFSTITLAGAGSIILAQMAVRNLVSTKLGWEAVAYWQSTIRLSDVYMQFISMILANYTIPKLVKAPSNTLQPTFWALTLKIFFLFLLGATCLWLARVHIYKGLYSPDYISAAPMLAPQLVGDGFRIIAVSLSTFFIARASLHIPLLYELSQGLLFYLCTALLINSTGTNSPIYAYGITYATLATLMLALMTIKSRPGIPKK